MGRSFRPANVYHVAKINLSVPSVADGSRVRPPIWLKVIERIPPSEMLIRPKPTPHRDPNPRQRRPRYTFRPQQITYPEDELRRTFFKDHPWELARPRISVELDGKDGHMVDWSKGLQQPGRQISGESVVQRQLWLMENGYPEVMLDEKRRPVFNQAGEPVIGRVRQVSKDEAYDIARKEFYTHRQREDIARRIAQEEARMVGAYFGKSRLQIGMELEDKVYEHWKSWAKNESIKLQSRRDSAYATFGNEDKIENLADLGLEEEEEEGREGGQEGGGQSGNHQNTPQ